VSRFDHITTGPQNTAMHRLYASGGLQNPKNFRCNLQVKKQRRRNHALNPFCSQECRWHLSKTSTGRSGMQLSNEPHRPGRRLGAVQSGSPPMSSIQNFWAISLKSPLALNLGRNVTLKADSRHPARRQAGVLAWVIA